MQIVQESRPNPDFCPQCGSYKITFDKAYGFRKCSECNHLWAYPEDDPDYEEIEDFLICELE